jgi:hypothetical protein
VSDKTLGEHENDSFGRSETLDPNLLAELHVEERREWQNATNEHEKDGYGGRSQTPDRNFLAT